MRAAMKRILVLLWMSGLLAHGHVGSPNVFFEGQAGPYPVRVIIRPPSTLPGIAQVDVRATGHEVTDILLQAAPWDAGAEAAPDPIRAAPVAGETDLFNAALWLLRGGSYRVRVTVAGSRGNGAVVVPLNSASLQRPVMSPVIRVALAVMGAMLFIAAVWLAGAAVRDSTREPGVAPTTRDRTRARVGAIGATLIVLGAVCAGGMRWQRMDREFRSNALYKPLPVAATVRTNGSLHLLHMTPTRDEAGIANWDTLVADHGKLMHLFLLREPDFNAFAHLHPVRRNARNFESVLPPLPAGQYRLYAEVTDESGLSQTLVSGVSLPLPFGRPPQLINASNMLNEVFCQSVTPPAGSAPQPFALDADDSWHTAPSSAGRQVSPLMGGRTMAFQNSGDLIANRETSLRFSVFTRDGAPAALQPYMGMLGHAVVRRSDGEVFTHLHPVGTISMAAQELLARRELGATNSGSAMPFTGGNEVAFPYAFPRSGNYRLWVQVRTDGRVLTGVFDVLVN